MKFTLEQKSVARVQADLAVVFVEKGASKLPPELAAWDKELAGVFAARTKEEGAYEAGAVFVVQTLGRLPIRAIATICIEDDSSVAALKRGFSAATRLFEKQRAKKVLVILPQQSSSEESITLAVETIQFSGYHFTKYKTKKSADQKQPTPIKHEIVLAISPALPLKKAQRALEIGRVLADSADIARDLANEPSNVLFPEAFAEFAQKEAARTPGLTCRVLHQREIIKKGMGLHAAVGQGSAHPPALVVFEYRGGKPQEPFYGFVGKGITFDSGGISLKTGEAAYSMSHMKRDMAGAACVLAVLRSLAQLRIPVNAVGVMSMAENMPDGGSHKPGDILTSLSGKTVEIYHTDAEGRLVVADGLAYAQQEYKIGSLIDIATLTGEVVRVFGPDLTAVFCNNNKLYKLLKSASRTTGEQVWRMPLFQPYADKVKGAFADLRELNFEMPNAIASALFLQQFVEKPVAWAHLDIAGTEEYALPDGGKGSTASAVRLLVQYVMQDQSAMKN